MFAYEQSKYGRMVLMKREVNESKAYKDVIRQVESPNRTVTDNAQFLTG